MTIRISWTNSRYYKLYKYLIYLVEYYRSAYLVVYKHKMFRGCTTSAKNSDQ